MRLGVAGAIKLDLEAAKLHEIAQARRVLPTRRGRRRAQIVARIGRSPAGELEGQTTEIIGILVAAGDGQNARAKNAAQRMRDQQGIARIRDDGGELARHAQPALGLPQQHHVAVRDDATAVESRADLRAANGWKREREKVIVEPGGSDFEAMARRIGECS